MRQVFYFTLLLILSTAPAQAAGIQDCAQLISNNTKMNPSRAEKGCKKASRQKQDLSAFGSCVVNLNGKTHVAPEILMPFCLLRSDEKYQSCVESDFKNDSNENPLKSCLKRADAPPAESKGVALQTLKSPGKVRIKVL